MDDFGHYKLVGKNVVPCTFTEWANWLERNDERKLAQSTYRHFWISTVFLGIPHPGGIFETMIFYRRRGRHSDSQSDIWCRRAHNYDQALATHKEALNAAKTGQLMRNQRRSKSLKQIRRWMEKWKWRRSK